MSLSSKNSWCISFFNDTEWWWLKPRLEPYFVAKIALFSDQSGRGLALIAPLEMLSSKS